MKNTQIIVHVPHSSTCIPQKYQDIFLLNKQDLSQELITMTDLYVDKLFENIGHMIRFPLSRLLCDVERFRDPLSEEMTAVGMWICYEKTSNGKTLKFFDEQHIHEMLLLYDRHHNTLENAVTQCLKENEEVLIIDAHSFPSQEQDYELYKGAKRPDVCIGTDYYHTPEELVTSLSHHFQSYGLSTGINTPFKGTLVPLKFYHKNPRIHSVMIEINKSLYVNEKTGMLQDLRIQKIIEDFFNLHQ